MIDESLNESSFQRQVAKQHFLSGLRKNYDKDQPLHTVTGGSRVGFYTYEIENKIHVDLSARSND